MALWANLPVALAPGMGTNFFFVFTVCGALGFSWREALAANLVAGLAFLALSRVGLREKVMHAVPPSLQAAIGAGIGLLIASVGLRWAGLVVPDPATGLAPGGMGSPVARLALAGLALVSILLVLRVRGAILLGIAGTALLGAFGHALLGSAEPLVRAEALVGAPPAPTAAFALDFAGLVARPWADLVAVVGVLLLLDLFDTIGTLTALGRQAGWMRAGELPRARQALAADAAGTTLGALLGTSTITSYVESAAGISAGGRTGLVSLVVAACFLAALVLRPAVEALGAGVPLAAGEGEILCQPVIAPVLIVVGALMLSALADVEWQDLGHALPAFLTVLVMPLTLSITDGIAWGFTSFSLLSIVRGRARACSWLVHAFAALFVLRWVWLAG
jgi:AGZA family xanthine/uracil permease-like MFS transporter